MLVVSIGLLILTLNPLFAALFPYVRASWPALKTAFWLKKRDPWRARGTAGLYFHLCMALFWADVWAMIFVAATQIISGQPKNDHELIPMVIAAVILMVSAILSVIFSWIGMVVALRNGVKIFVVSNLCRLCHGDFAAAAKRESSVFNPAIILIAFGTAIPLVMAGLLASFLVARQFEDFIGFVLLGSLIITVVLCLLSYNALSSRIAAKSPAECWGVETPESEHVRENWYQTLSS